MSEGGKKSVAEGISALAQAGALFAGEVAGYDVIIKDPPPRLASYVVIIVCSIFLRFQLSGLNVSGERSVRGTTPRSGDTAPG